MHSALNKSYLGAEKLIFLKNYRRDIGFDL